MIDCLSNPSWINPQIDFLLFLQNIRIAHFEAFNKLFLSITIFGELWLPTLVCAITYWCVDFRAGLYLFSLEGFNIILTHFAKMLACVYRPWVLSDKMCPVKEAVTYAKGYSFPSGHSSNASSVFGGVAFLQKHNILKCALLILLILLVGFSRLWLGVHTPQDVIFGLSTGLILVFALNFMINWAEKDKNRYLYLLGIINTFTALALIYICYFNTYRIDYINGELLVNPIKSINTTVVSMGFALGIINGTFLCRRFLLFNPKEGSKTTKILRGLIGGILTIMIIQHMIKHVFLNIISFRIAFIETIIVGLFITLLYPLIFTKIEKLWAKK